MKNKFLHELIKPDDKLILGVSGGADSMCLLHYITTNFKNKVTVCHVNHNLRGDESLRDRDFVKETCARLAVPCLVLEVDIARLARQQGISIEECARNTRYSFFARQEGIIVTAHTLSDRAETLIFNIIRGCGTSGIKSILARRGNIIRPLINCTRKEIEEYCTENSVEYLTDSTNLQPDYTRNKIRLNIIPQLKQINPNFEKAVFKLCQSAQADNDYLDEITKKIITKITTKDGYDAKLLQIQHKAVRMRAITTVFNTDYDKTTAIDNILSRGGKINIKKDMFITVKKGKIKQEKEVKIKPFFTREFVIEKDGFLINKQQYEKFYKKDYIFAVDYDKIFGKTIIRQRISSDKIKLANRPTKTLKKLFNEKGYSQRKKSETPVLSDDNGVIFVQGIGTDIRVEIDNNTKHILVIGNLEIED